MGEKVAQVGSGNSSHVNDVAQKTSLAGEVGQKVENVQHVPEFPLADAPYKHGEDMQQILAKIWPSSRKIRAGNIPATISEIEAFPTSPAAVIYSLN